jgi:hypothetical protein
MSQSSGNLRRLWSSGSVRNVTASMIKAVNKSPLNSIRQRKSFIIISFSEGEWISRLGEQNFV